MKPGCSRLYSVPRANKGMFEKEVERLVKLEVLEEANDSKWGAMHFSNKNKIK